MADSLAQQKKKMRDVLGRMSKKYGVVKPGNTRADIEQCAYLVLREGWDFRKASRAVKSLVETFVDWNEVRVSSLGEIMEAVSFLKYKDLNEKVRRMRLMLREIYQEYNRMNLEFLMTEEFEDTRKYFGNLASLGAGNAYVFLQCLHEEMDEAAEVETPTLVMSTEMLRVGIRLGLIKRTGSHNVGRKAFSKLVEPSEYLSLQYNFVRHGDGICTSKSPACTECFLNTVCDFYKP